MKHQALFSSKDKSKQLKCRLLQFLFGPLRVKLPVHFEQPSFPSVVTAVVVTVAAVFVVVVAAAVVVTAVASVPDPACAGAFAVPHHKHSQYQVFVLVLDLCTKLPASLTEKF